jgi:hypothetical protein
LRCSKGRSSDPFPAFLGRFLPKLKPLVQTGGFFLRLSNGLLHTLDDRDLWQNVKGLS